MTTVLCYGDSNTYGYNPENGLRYPADIRWTGVLKNLLGPDYAVVEEGCNGRTTVFEDPVDGWKNGLTYLKPCLNSHKPIDIVIMMLGSNDLKRCYHNVSARESAEGAGVLVDIIEEFLPEKQGFAPKIILVSPPLIGPDIANSPFYVNLDESAIERSAAFRSEFERIAREKGCIFFDAAPVAVASELDSLHLSPESHRALAEALCEVVLRA